MTIKSRVTQDSRTISRIATRLNCHFTNGGSRYEAVMIDLSMGGAFLSSKALPQTGSTIHVTIKNPALKKDLSLESVVMRGVWVDSDHGKLGRFGIRFVNTPLELLMLISSLSK